MYTQCQFTMSVARSSQVRTFRACPLFFLVISGRYLKAHASWLLTRWAPTSAPSWLRTSPWMRSWTATYTTQSYLVFPIILMSWRLKAVSLTMSPSASTSRCGKNSQRTWNKRSFTLSLSASCKPLLLYQYVLALECTELHQSKYLVKLNECVLSQNVYSLCKETNAFHSFNRLDFLCSHSTIHAVG